jgi:hypothetical protein
MEAINSATSIRVPWNKGVESWRYSIWRWTASSEPAIWFNCACILDSKSPCRGNLHALAQGNRWVEAPSYPLYRSTAYPLQIRLRTYKRKRHVGRVLAPDSPLRTAASGMCVRRDPARGVPSIKNSPNERGTDQPIADRPQNATKRNNISPV